MLRHIGLLLLLVLDALPLPSQTLALGGTFGFTASTLAQNFTSDPIFSYRTGLIAGAEASLRVYRDLSIATGIMLVPRGAAQRPPNDFVFRSKYVEIPLLLRYGVRPFRPLLVFAEGGAAWARERSCTWEAPSSLPEPSDCNFVSDDFAALGGGGAQFSYRRTHFVAGVRYYHGIKNLDPETDRNWIRNRSWLFLFTISRTILGP